MVFKRYIQKGGIAHGPYYYKNIRDESGNVKSVYLGKKIGIHNVIKEKGGGPLKLTITILFILLILISILFFVQNKNLVLNRIAIEEDLVPFEVDQILIKVLIKTEESLIKEIRVMNTGTNEETIKIYAIGLLDIVKINDKEFKISPGQTKIVEINFSSFNKVRNIEHTPGVYIGKIIVGSENFEKEIPIVAEIETKEVLFDSNLNPVSRDKNVLQGQDVTIEVRLFNLQSIGPTTVDMDYFVKDLNGNTIISESENVVVETQASFFKTLKTPQNLKFGSYVFASQATYGNSVGTSSYLFEVIREEKKSIIGFIPLNFVQFCRNDILCWSLSLIILLLIFTTGAYLYFFLGAYIYGKFFGAKPSFKKGPKEEHVMVIKEKLGRRQKRLIKKCRKLLKKGYRALEKDKTKLAKKLYDKSMELYFDLSNEFKKEIYSEINNLYEQIKNVKRGKERKGKFKLELEKQKEIEKEKRKRIELEKKEKEEKKPKEDRRQKRLIKKCRKLLKIGYRALEKDKTKLAKKLYDKSMELYFDLSNEFKKEIHSEINHLYEQIKNKKVPKEKVEKRVELEKIKIDSEIKIKDKRIEKEKYKLELEKQKKIEKEKSEREKEERKREEERKRIELEKREKELQKKKKIKEKQEKIDKINKLELGIKNKKQELDKLIESLKNSEYEKNKLNKIIRYKEIEIKKIAKRRKFSKYNVKKEKKKKIEDKFNYKLKKWKDNYNKILSERNRIKNEIKGRYEKEVQELSEELKGKNLSEKEKKELEKWKRVHIMAKWKLQENKKLKKKEEEENKLLDEKEKILKKYKRILEKKNKELMSLKQIQDNIDGILFAKEDNVKNLRLQLYKKVKDIKSINNDINKKTNEINLFEKDILTNKKDIDGMGFSLFSFFKKSEKTKIEKRRLNELKKRKEEERRKKKEEEERRKLEEIRKEEESKKKGKEEREKLKLIERRGKIIKIEEKKGKRRNLFRNWFKRRVKAEQPREKEEVKVEEDIDLKNLERHITGMGRGSKGDKGLKPKRTSFLGKIGLFEKEKKEKRKGKRVKIEKEKDSNLFVKCSDLMNKSNKYLEVGNKIKAKKEYSKARKIYLKLPHEEKKKLHNDLVKLYNKLSK